MWLIILALFSLLLALIVALAIRKTVKGQLPACGQCTSDRRRFIMASLGGWLLSILLVTLGMAMSSGAVVALGFVVMFAALCFSFCGDQFRVRGGLRNDAGAPGFAPVSTRC